MRKLLLLATLFLRVVFAAEDWGPAQFLIGAWTGEGGGQPGGGSGSFSFTPDFQGKVLIRKSFAEYPGRNGRPASRHDDLTILYREASRLHAIYFDNEGHVIRYSVEAAPLGGVVFTAEGPPTQARYRLSYMPTGKDRLKLRFEVADPGKDFTTYIEATAHRE